MTIKWKRWTTKDTKRVSKKEAAEMAARHLDVDWVMTGDTVLVVDDDQVFRCRVLDVADIAEGDR